MSDTNVAQVLRLIEGIKTLDTAVIGEALAEDATWEIPADPARLAIGGTMDRAAFLELIGGLGGALPGGVVLTPVGITAQDDRVAVEPGSAGKHPGPGNGESLRGRTAAARTAR